ncbi:transglycosylase domain-containing protein [Streptomyces sp. HNM0663]|uniref:Transglycosylase domain-containing protein n=1 Tax=Streptomyces chengmaiensis TaxID=3040919 RepID=A0ABT6HP31_9ACTN|nr:transglycosylase domain-containing protein [Streptomyces chengmaiensis]MDH2390480.1 transglycosylase domain-containing protein [Streptomyces chengmaiensis]
MSEAPREPGQGWTPRDATAVGPPPAADAASQTAWQTAWQTAGEARTRRTGLRRLIPTRRMVLGSLLAGPLLLLAAFAVGYLLVDIPPANAAATAQSNVYYYEDGAQIVRDGEVNRENVPLAQVPLTVQQAVLAAEDRGFYTQSAVAPKAMLRAGWNTLTGKGTQSGSTITQQYVKNYYLKQDRTITRKVKEFFIALKLSREASKHDILQGYLNTSYFGRNAYGIQAAAQSYYGKDAEDLDTAEGAYLAALLNAPSAYDVAARPGNRPAALARWNYVLDGMVKEQWLSPAERAAMTFPPPRKAKPAGGLSGQRGYIVQTVEEYLTSNKIIDPDALAAGGYRITTTLQRPRQDALVQAVEEQVISRLDPGSRAEDDAVRIGGVAIDPPSGKVVALYGGVDYTEQYVNNATRRDYQVGSTFKPFVFAAAVQHGATTQDGRRITPGTLYDGTNQRAVEGWRGKPYAPENEDDASYGPITVSTATDRSVNAVYAQMAVDVGPARVKQTAIDLGLPRTTPDLKASPSIALGPATASVLDMAVAYATLANHGRQGAHDAYTIVEKITKNGAEVRLPAGPGKQTVSRQAADTTTAMLRGVVDSGTGTAAQAAGRPAAGKTGTAEEDRAAWFAGYTPDLATVIAMMGQDPATNAQEPLYGALGLPRVNGGGPPARIWGQFTAAALDGHEVRDFDLELPEGMADGLPPEHPEPWEGFDGPWEQYPYGETEQLTEEAAAGMPETPSDEPFAAVQAGPMGEADQPPADQPPAAQPQAARPQAAHPGQPQRPGAPADQSAGRLAGPPGAAPGSPLSGPLTDPHGDPLGDPFGDPPGAPYGGPPSGPLNEPLSDPR